MLRANTFGKASANGTPQANEKHCSHNCSLTIVTTTRDNVDRPAKRCTRRRAIFIELKKEKKEKYVQLFSLLDKRISLKLEHPSFNKFLSIFHPIYELAGISIFDMIGNILENR